MAWLNPREVIASAARTTTDQSGTIAISGAGTYLSLLVDVTTQSGVSPTLDISVEWSFDGGTTWAAGDTADSFNQVAASTPKKVKRFDIKAPYYRVKWSIGGTAAPSYTFSIREYVF